MIASATSGYDGRPMKNLRKAALYGSQGWLVVFSLVLITLLADLFQNMKVNQGIWFFVVALAAGLFWWFGVAVFIYEQAGGKLDSINQDERPFQIAKTVVIVGWSVIMFAAIAGFAL